MSTAAQKQIQDFVQGFTETLYVQRRYIQSIGVDNPVFVFTVPTENRLQIEAHILTHLKTWFGGHIEIADAARTPHASFLGLKLPAYSKWMMPEMQVNILLLDKNEMDDLFHAGAPS